MENGWVKVHRELINHPIWKKSTPEQKTILITLLCMANHESNRWEWQGREFSVEPGQFVTSIEHIRQSCGKGISTQNVRSALVRFKKLEFLTYESTKTGTLITIEKWGKWQGGVDEPNKEPNKEVTKRSQTGNKQVTTNKNDKNDKNDKKYIYRDVPDEIREPFMQWAEMRKQIRKPITTKNTVDRALSRLNKLADTTEKKIEIIQLAIDNCWQSFYKPKPEEKQTTRYKEFQKEDYERDDFESIPMPDDIREKYNDVMSGMEVK